MKKLISRLQEFSIPLILGVIAAMVAANVGEETYHAVVHSPLTDIWGILWHGAAHHADGHEGWGHYFSIHFLANDIFMALFFGVAAKEITEACLPNGALNPPKKAINPLFGTVGGVVGPIVVFLGLNAVMGKTEWQNGWGIPTATDIALAWLVARLLFGKGHPAVSFLLLLAVADDAIGLGIIAIGYPDPAHPTQWSNLVWLIPGMVSAAVMRWRSVKSWIPYIAIGGSLCWWGLFSAHLHPALALVFVVPFLPPPRHDLGLFTDDADVDEHPQAHSTLEKFEHDVKAFVDFGLFFFAFANAGVAFSGVTNLTWIVLLSLIVGKFIGITGCSYLAHRMGFALPAGMTVRHLVLTSVIAALGLTVALFVSGQAFTDGAMQGAAKMGAVLSAGVAGLAWVLREVLGLSPGKRSWISGLKEATPQSPSVPSPAPASASISSQS